MSVDVFRRNLLRNNRHTLLQTELQLRDSQEEGSRTYILNRNVDGRRNNEAESVINLTKH